MDNVTEKKTIDKKNTKKIVLVLLCVCLAILFIANAITLTLAYFTDQKQSATNSFVTTGTVAIDAKVKNSSSYVDGPIALDNSVLMAGAETQKYIKVEVTGNNTCYIRMSCDFQIYLNGAYQSRNFVTMNIDSTMTNPNEGNFYSSNWISGSDGKLYLTTSLVSSSSNIIPVKFTVGDIGNGNLEGTESYQNCAYKIIITIDTVQSTGVTLGSDSTSVVTSWPTNS